jgi:hypothetical protein
MSAPIKFTYDTSTSHNGLTLTRDGKPVQMEEAFREGFVIQPQDSNIVLTLLTTWIQNKEHSQC